MIPLRGNDPNGADITNVQQLREAPAPPISLTQGVQQLPNAAEQPPAAVQPLAEPQIMDPMGAQQAAPDAAYPEEEGPKPMAIPNAPPSPSLAPDENVKNPADFQTPSFEETDAKSRRINEALDAIKNSLVSDGQEYSREKTWAEMVEKMVTEYQTKDQNVRAHMDTLRTKMKQLLTKKRQIENVQSQMMVKAKLQDALSDKETLQEALDTVKAQSETFSSRKKEIADMIDRLNGQLSSLKGGSDDKEMEADGIEDGPEGAAEQGVEDGEEALAAEKDAAGGESLAQVAMKVDNQHKKVTKKHT
jgi:hypothetical protein